MKAAADKPSKGAILPGKSKDIDLQIGSLARKGAFEQSGLPAIEEALKSGRTATVLEGNNIIRLHPDGTKEIIKKLDQQAKAS